MIIFWFGYCTIAIQIITFGGNWVKGTWTSCTNFFFLKLTENLSLFQIKEIKKKNQRYSYHLGG